MSTARCWRDVHDEKLAAVRREFKDKLLEADAKADEAEAALQLQLEFGVFIYNEKLAAHVRREFEDKLLEADAKAEEAEAALQILPLWRPRRRSRSCSSSSSAQKTSMSSRCSGSESGF